MTQSKVLLFTLVVTIGTTLAEVLAEIGRNRLATDLFDIQGAGGRRRSRQTQRARLQKMACLNRTTKPNHRLPVRRRVGRHI
jgi:hypothetical protein